MEPNNKKTRKRAKKAVAENQPAAPVAKIVQTDNYSSWRDEEELVDYDPEEPARFSPVEVDISVEEDNLPAHGDGPADNNPISNDFPAYLAEGADMAGRKRCQNVFEEGEHSRKTSRSIGVGSPLQEDNNSTTYDERMDLEALPTGGRGSGITSAALPMGAARQDARPLPYQWGAAATQEAIPLPYQWGGSEARRTPASLPMGAAATLEAIKGLLRQATCLPKVFQQESSPSDGETQSKVLLAVPFVSALNLLREPCGVPGGSVVEARRCDQPGGHASVPQGLICDRKTSDLAPALSVGHHVHGFG